MKLYPNDPKDVMMVANYHCKQSDDALFESVSDFMQQFETIFGKELPRCLDDLLWQTIGAALQAGANNQMARVVESNPTAFKIVKEEEDELSETC